MIRLGAAWVYVKYVQDPSLSDLQMEARLEQVGLWGLENPIPPWEWRQGSRDPEAVVAGLSPSDSCVIKGNVNRKGDRIFHVPGSRNYGSTVINISQGERWFCSEDDAREAGWRAAR